MKNIWYRINNMTCLKSLLDKTPVKEILADCDYKNVKKLIYEQLKTSYT